MEQIIQTTHCNFCNDMRFFLSNNEEGFRDLQKCDECNVFESDSDAKAYVKTYILPTYERHVC